MIKSGTTIACPKCGQTLGSFNRDVYPREKLNSSLVNPEPKYTKHFKNGTRMASPCCNEKYFLTSFFTGENGWLAI